LQQSWKHQGVEEKKDIGQKSRLSLIVQNAPTWNIGDTCLTSIDSSSHSQKQRIYVILFKLLFLDEPPSWLALCNLNDKNHISYFNYKNYYHRFLTTVPSQLPLLSTRCFVIIQNISKCCLPVNFFALRISKHVCFRWCYLFSQRSSNIGSLLWLFSVFWSLLLIFSFKICYSITNINSWTPNQKTADAEHETFHDE
jgi:hypothetical protein